MVLKKTEHRVSHYTVSVFVTTVLKSNITFLFIIKSYTTYSIIVRYVNVYYCMLLSTRVSVRVKVRIMLVSSWLVVIPSY